MVTNLEAQTEEFKAGITALYKAIQERFNEKSHVIIEGGKGTMNYWSKHPSDCNPYFQEEFSHVVSNEEVVESDNDFSPDIYDDT